MQTTNPPRSSPPAAARLVPNLLRRAPVSERPHVALSLLLISLLIASGCIRAKRTPNLERVFAQARLRTGKRPLIVVPGVLGSQLINYETGEVVWPSAFRSSADGLSLPVS